MDVANFDRASCRCNSEKRRKTNRRLVSIQYRMKHRVSIGTVGSDPVFKLKFSTEWPIRQVGPIVTVSVLRKRPVKSGRMPIYVQWHNSAEPAFHRCIWWRRAREISRYRQPDRLTQFVGVVLCHRIRRWLWIGPDPDRRSGHLHLRCQSIREPHSGLRLQLLAVPVTTGGASLMQSE